MRVSFVAFVLALSIAVSHECGHHEARLFGGPRPGQATPLRSVPCGLAGLSGLRLRRRSGNYVMAAGTLSSGGNIKDREGVAAL